MGSKFFNHIDSILLDKLSNLLFCNVFMGLEQYMNVLRFSILFFQNVFFIGMRSLLAGCIIKWGFITISLGQNFQVF